MIRHLSASLALGLLLAAVAAAAQEGSAVYVRGTIAAMEGETLAVTGEAGGVTLLTLAPDVRISGLSRHAFSEIAAGGFVCATSVVAPDGPPMAMEVEIFPDAAPGAGAQACSGVGGSMMVAGIVERVEEGVGWPTIEVSVDGETILVVVAPETPIVDYRAGDAGMLAPGAPLAAFATRSAGGALTADRIIVGLDGAVPGID